jgi:hypothetical protein
VNLGVAMEPVKITEMEARELLLGVGQYARAYREVIRAGHRQCCQPATPDR